MKTEEKKQLHLHYCREMLQEELYKQSAYVASSFTPPPGDGSANWSDRWLLTTDEAPLSVILLQEAYGKVYALLSGYLLEASGLNLDSPGFDYILEVPQTLPPGQEEIIAFSVQQVMIYYALYRWYAQKNIDVSAHFLSLYQTVSDDIRSQLNRRTSPPRRPQRTY